MRYYKTYHFSNTYKNRLQMTDGTQNKPVRNLKKLRTLLS